MSGPTKAQLEAQVERLTSELMSAMDEQDILLARIDILTGVVSGANATIGDIAQRYGRVVAQNIELLKERAATDAQSMHDRVAKWGADRADLVPDRESQVKWSLKSSSLYNYSPDVSR